MKICLQCNRGLFNNDTKCDKCGCLDIMDKDEYQNLYDKFKKASFKEQEILRQLEEYKIICKYKFIVDKKNTPEMRRQQSIKDKQAAEQKSQQEYEALKRRAQQKRIEKERIEKQQNTPKCPTCGSTNIEKISTTSKAIGFVAVGIFSSNFGKTMHCKQCGYKW